MTNANAADLLCFSHLRWDFVYQRPQHLMSRFARQRRVFFVEEPVRGSDRIEERVCPDSGVHVLVPHLSADEEHLYRNLLHRYITQNQIGDCIAWYYTPMALPIGACVAPRLTVYDCMDELSAFAGAPPALKDRERELFHQADLVFTGGASLYASKRSLHPNVHLFPSSIDAGHFKQARRPAHAEPSDQSNISRPRIGYAGVIDERMDIDLLRLVAAARPHWQFVLLGPVVKIDPSTLPQAPNIHYLGMKTYAELPTYMAGWNIGMLPFALNQSTRYISPTKTPEYLAAGLRVISTPIHDVIHPYADLGLVEIASKSDEFIAAVEQLLRDGVPDRFRQEADCFLSRSSWDATAHDMQSLINEQLALSEEMKQCSTT